MNRGRRQVQGPVLVLLLCALRIPAHLNGRYECMPIGKHLRVVLGNKQASQAHGGECLLG